MRLIYYFDSPGMLSKMNVIKKYVCLEVQCLKDISLLFQVYPYRSQKSNQGKKQDAFTSYQTVLHD